MTEPFELRVDLPIELLDLPADDIKATLVEQLRRVGPELGRRGVRQVGRLTLTVAVSGLCEGVTGG